MRQPRRSGKVPRKRITESERDCGGDRSFFPCMHAWRTRWPSRRSQQLILAYGVHEWISRRQSPSGKTATPSFLINVRSARPSKQDYDLLPEGRWDLLVEFRTADGRLHRSMLESAARVTPRCLDAVRSWLRAAQL